MLRNTSVISISLLPDSLEILEKLCQKEAKSRSQIIKELLLEQNQKQAWDTVFDWGRNTKEQMAITSEEDILKLIND